MMNIVETSFDGNQALLDYFRTKPVDLSDHADRDDLWDGFVSAYLDDAERAELAHAAGIAAEDTNWSDYHALPPALQRAFGDYLEHLGIDRDIIHHDPHDAPSWMLMGTITDELLPPDTWILHFTDHADAIAQHGFQKGVEDLDRLALTHLRDVFGNVTRRTSDNPGYNFGYLVTDLDFDRRVDAYGRDAVMFRGSGLHVYHAGDREEQVIFFGPQVDPSTIVVLRHVGSCWRVEKDGLIRHTSATLNAAVEWVVRQ